MSRRSIIDAGRGVLLGPVASAPISKAPEAPPKHVALFADGAYLRLSGKMDKPQALAYAMGYLQGCSAMGATRFVGPKDDPGCGAYILPDDLEAMRNEQGGGECLKAVRDHERVR